MLWPFFLFINNPRKTEHLSWATLVEQKRDDDYEEDMFCHPLFIFLSLKVSYCKYWWKKVLWIFFSYIPIIPIKQTSYLEWPWLSRRGMMTMRRTCFAACCSFSCPFAQPSSQSLDSHSLSIEDALHSDYWIGFQWAHTLARTSAAAAARWR